ncbi:hypothetical protein AAMO2058_000638800 [Amorphochlora amoebiformis]
MSRAFTKFHIVDLMSTSIRFKKLSVLELAQGRLLMDSLFNQFTTIPVSLALINKAIASFTRAHSLEGHLELEAAHDLARVLRTAKPGQAFLSLVLSQESVRWAGTVTVVTSAKSSKRLLVLTTRAVWVFRLSNLRQEHWKIEHTRIGLIRHWRDTNKFTLCVPTLGDRTILCLEATKVCTMINAYVARVNRNNARYIDVVPTNAILDVPCSVQSCVRGFRMANVTFIRSTTTIRRCWGTLTIKGGNIRKSTRFYCQLRGSILSGMPASEISQQKQSSRRPSNIESTDVRTPEKKSARMRSMRSTQLLTRARTSLSNKNMNSEADVSSQSADNLDAEMNSSTYVRTGWLFRRMHSMVLGNIYKTFWVRLQVDSGGVRLEFLKKPSSDTVLFTTELSSAKPFKIEIEDRPDYFHITQDEKEIHLHAYSPEEAKEWVNILVKILYFLGSHRKDTAEQCVRESSCSPRMQPPQAQTTKRNALTSWLFGKDKSKEEILQPIDLLGCTVSESTDPERPLDLEISWWQSDKVTFRLTCDGYKEMKRWLHQIDLASAAANSLKEHNGFRWKSFDPALSVFAIREESKCSRSESRIEDSSNCEQDIPPELNTPPAVSQ